MSKYKLINGFTKSSVKSVIRAEFKGWASKGGGICQYRLVTPATTLKCAVGCFIPDQFYDESMEGCSPASPKIRAVSHLLPLTEQGLTAFQNFHDANADKATLKSKKAFEAEPLEDQIAKLEEWVDDFTIEPKEADYETAK